MNNVTQLDAHREAELIDRALRLIIGQHSRMRLALELIGSTAPEDSDIARLARRTLEGVV